MYKECQIAAALLGLLGYDLLDGASDDSANVKLLEAATKATRNSSGYHVELRATGDKGEIAISGEIAGDDFDLTFIGSTSLRLRSVRGKYWKSPDDGSTWSATARDRSIYNLAFAAARGYVPPNWRVEVVGRENLTHGTLIWLEIRPDPPPSDLDKRLPRFGIVQSSDGSTFLQRYKGVISFMAVPVFADVTYSKIAAIQRIMAPQ